MCKSVSLHLATPKKTHRRRQVDAGVLFLESILYLRSESDDAGLKNAKRWGKNVEQVLQLEPWATHLADINKEIMKLAPPPASASGGGAPGTANGGAPGNVDSSGLTFADHVDMDGSGN